MSLKETCPRTRTEQDKNQHKAQFCNINNLNTENKFSCNNDFPTYTVSNSTKDRFTRLKNTKQFTIIRNSSTSHKNKNNSISSKSLQINLRQSN